MKILIFLTTAILFVTIGCSFDTDYEKSVKKTEDCLEKKAENLKYSSVDEALSNYDFETARILLSCYSKDVFKYDGSITLNGAMADGWSEHTKILRTIVRAEISYMINNDMVERAKAVAEESNHLDIFIDQLPQIIKKYASRGDFKKAFGLIIEYPFEVGFEARYSSNDGYNDEINKYNNLIDIVLNYAIIGKEKDIAEKCLQFYKPISVSTSKGSKLVHSPRDEASKRVSLGN